VFGLLCNVNSIVAKIRWTVWQLFEGGLLLEGEVVGTWDVLQSMCPSFLVTGHTCCVLNETNKG